MPESFLKQVLILSSVVLMSCGGGGGGGGSSGGTTPPSGGGSGGTQNQAPVASAGDDASLELSSESFVLDGSGSSDPDGDNLSYSWSISQRPSGSNISLSNSNTESASFTPDLAGDYVFELRVTDPGNLSDTDSVTITFSQASIKTLPLSAGFTDAEFDDVNNRVVTVQGSILTIIGIDGAETTVDLPEDANVVGLSPDGNFAVAGHIEKISYLDLSSAQIISTIDVPLETAPDNAPFSDIILDSRGFAHLFSNSQSPQTASVDLENGTIELSTTFSFEGSVGKLHPNGRTIYTLSGKDSGFSSDVERFRILDGRLHNFDFDGDINAVDAIVFSSVCNDLWMGFNGTALTGCHNLIRLSDSPQIDRKIIRQLGPDTTVIQHASSSPYMREWYVIDTHETNPTVDLGNTMIDVYDADSGNSKGALALPDTSSGADADWNAKFVFADGQSDTLHILAVDDLQSPSQYAMLLYPNRLENSDETNLPPIANAQRYSSAHVNEAVVLDAGNSNDPEGAALTYNWTLVNQPAGSAVTPSGLDSAIVEFTPTTPGVYGFELRVSDGTRESAVIKSDVQVVEAGSQQTLRLGSAAVDAEFSKPLNSVVYLSDQNPEVVILNMDTLESRTVPLSKPAYHIGISPNGLFAAVSHDDLASLIDLSSGTLMDQQATNLHFGDIILDRNNIAHFSPSWFLFDDVFFEASDVIYSVDFENNAVTEGGESFNGSFLKLHPSLDSVYGLWRILSSPQIAKLDLANGLTDFKYATEFIDDSLDSDLWLSETGDRIVTQGELVFTADPDPAFDLDFVTKLSDILIIRWADHSEEQGQWIATTKAITIKGDDIYPTIDREYFIFDDASFTLQQRVDIEVIQTPTGQGLAAGQEVFYSDDGSRIYMMLLADELVDGAAIRIIE